MLISKKQLKISKYAPKNIEKPSLGGVRFSGSEAVVCDDQIMIRVTNQNKNTEEYPVVLETPAEAEINSNPVTIPTSTCEKALKNMPKKAKLNVINEYAEIWIEKEKHKIGITDLENSLILEGKNIDLDYPNYHAFFPGEEKYKSTVYLDAIKLKILCEAVIEHSTKDIEGSVPMVLKITNDSKSPICFKSKDKELNSKIDGLLMPLDMERIKSYWQERR